jgi:Ser/Thr protein kinase RdoA (MazF antagonist)
MAVFPVEYSTLSSQALLQLVKDNYPVTDASITFLKRGFNDTYLIKEPACNFILRVYKHNWREIESIHTEIKLLEYLKKNGISVSYPIKNLKEEYIQQISAPEGTRYAVLFSFAEGVQVRKLSTAQAYLFGIETGKIHALTCNKTFGKPANDYTIEAQFAITLATLKPLLINYPEQYNYLEKLKAEFITIFSGLQANALQTGICHGDLQAENFHITPENKITFFDFDFFGSGYLAYDIGVFRWYDHKNKTPQVMDAFLKGYQTVKALSAAEIRMIPYFSTLRALFQMALYCKLSDGHHLPLWPIQQVAEFINKVDKWHSEQTKNFK